MIDKSLLVIKNNFRFKREYLKYEILPALDKIQKVFNPIIKTYLISGKKIKLVFYSEALLNKLFKAISHNEYVYHDEPDLVIFVWDSSIIDIVTPWTNNYEYLEESLEDNQNFLGVYLYNERTLNIYDGVNNTAYFWINNAEDLTYWVIAAPFRTIFHWFFSRYNIHLIHGASVGINGKSVLLTAKGGSGKSTTALHCLFNEMDYLGDDYIIIDNNKSQINSLFSSLKVSPKLIDKFPELQSMVWNRDDLSNKDEKTIIFLSELFTKNIVKSSALNAIFIPIIKNNSVTKIKPATKLETMMAMAPTTIFQLSLTGYDKMSQLKSIVNNTPCYFLELGSDSNEVARTIKNFLSNE